MTWLTPRSQRSLRTLPQVREDPSSLLLLLLPLLLLSAYLPCTPAPAQRPRLLTVRAVAPAGALHAAAGIHTQEEVGGEEAPPAHVALQMRVAARSPRTVRGPRGAGRPCQQ